MDQKGNQIVMNITMSVLSWIVDERPANNIHEK